MKKLLIFSLAVFMFIGCAKKTLVRTGQQESAAVTATPTQEMEQEPSVRFSDWEKIPEMQIGYFDFDNSELTESARNVLKKNAEYMKNNTDLTFLVEGHCDERGTVEYNLALGQRRALSVREYYAKLGVPLTNIGTISYGSEKPAVLGTNEEAWAKNRRAETKVRDRK